MYSIVLIKKLEFVWFKNQQCMKAYIEIFQELPNTASYITYLQIRLQWDGVMYKGTSKG